VTLTFDIERKEETTKAFYFLVKEKYRVRIDRETGEGSCDCMADVFRKGGRKQKDCKHIKKAKELLKAVKKL